MLVKEYRIPLPLSVEEYRVAQLYMIAKKSREESRGAGSGVEILVNEPYTDGPGGSGQYTDKLYHLGNHLPGWLKALLPKSALIVREEAWNAYPYTKTRYTCSFIDKFYLEIETKYLANSGNSENVFEMTGSEFRNRTIDHIDIVKEQLYGSDYKREEDPKIFVSEKTSRGPLQDNWIEDVEKAMTFQLNGETPDVMCAYKLCMVEFKYWGMQNKIEKFIHETALRKTMLRAHRQAWAWQDEWVGLTMEDIRRIERETQEDLARRMAIENQLAAEANASSNPDGLLRPSGSGISVQEVDFTGIDKDKDNVCHELTATLPKSRSPSPHRLGKSKPPDLNFAHPPFVNEIARLRGCTDELSGDGRRKLWSRSNSKTALHSPSGSSTKSFDVQLATWRMESIVHDTDSSSDEEFFDAEDLQPNLPNLNKWSSLEAIHSTDDDQGTPDSAELVEVPATRPGIMASVSSIDTSLPGSPTTSPAHQPCPTSVLIFVLHSGSLLDTGVDSGPMKKMDLNTFKGAFETVTRHHYPTMSGRISIKLIACPAICAEALAMLSSLSPFSYQVSPSAIDGICHTQDAVPLSALPIFATSSPEYQEHVSRVIGSINSYYHEFLRLDEGQGFDGQVAIIGDGNGSLLAYDALCRSAQYNSHYGSETSIAEMETTMVPPNTPHGPPASPAVFGPRANPLISISDGSGAEEDGGTEKIRIPSTPARVYRKSHSHPQDPEPNYPEAFNYSRLLSAPPPRRRSSCSSDQSSQNRLDFDVADFFAFGSALGIILAYRKMLLFEDKNTPPANPMCGQLYNLFHSTDPLACRIEPLLHSHFSHIPPVTIPRYQKYPLGDGQPTHLLEYIQTHAHVFVEGGLSCTQTAFSLMGRRTSEASITSNMSGMIESLPLATVSAITQKWWGTKRIDYALYCPEAISNFPPNAITHLIHGSYWESFDAIAFVLRQIIRTDSLVHSGEDKEAPQFVPQQPREKWIKKRTSVKIKNVTANHRANDVIVKDGMPQMLTARFVYGPLDMVALTGEKIDIHVMKEQRSGEWTLLTTEMSDKTGRVSYTIPKEKAFGYGIFPIKMVVRGDHTSIDFFMAVIPPKTECVVFSIDGSFTASMSVTGRDPKVRAGAVDVVRHWQELGYLIIYITGRPDMQQQRVVAWLAQHNFPHGLVSFADGFSTDPLRHKADFLRSLHLNAEMSFHAAYGSSKDIWVYSTIGLQPDRIFTVGKASKKQHVMATVLTEGYAAHLSDLKAAGGSRAAQGNARMIIPRGCFSLPGSGLGALRQRRSAKRTTSYPLAGQSADCKPRGLSPKPPSSKI